MEVLDSRHMINMIPFLRWKWPVEGGGGRRWAGGTECQEVRGSGMRLLSPQWWPRDWEIVCSVLLISVIVFFSSSCFFSIFYISILKFLLYSHIFSEFDEHLTFNPVSCCSLISVSFSSLTFFSYSFSPSVPDFD